MIKNLIKTIKDNNYNNLVIKGHDNTDCDSFISCLLLKEFLEKNGIYSRIVITDNKIQKDTYEIIKETLHIDMNQYKDKINEKDNLILVDHYEEINLKNKIVGCIDHHPTEKEIKYDYYINMNSSSCGKLIFNLVSALEEINISKDFLYKVVISLYMDTCSFKSTKTLKSDELWSRIICKTFNFNEEHLYEIGLGLTDMNDNIEHIINNGRKEYVFNNRKIKSSYIQIDKEYNIQKYIDYIHNNLNDYYLWIFLETNMSTNTQKVHYITNNGYYCKYNEKILSRGKDIIPEVEKYINKL